MAGSGSSPIGASVEVLTEHVMRHRCPDGRPMRKLPLSETPCPCGECTVLACATCGEPIMLGAASDELCAHAREVL